MSNNDNDDNEETKHDLTRVEDLSEFLHQDDPETDAIFAQNDSEQDEEESSEDFPPPFDMNSSIDELEEDDTLQDGFDEESSDESEFENNDEDESEEDFDNTFEEEENESFASNESEDEGFPEIPDSEEESFDSLEENTDFNTADDFENEDQEETQAVEVDFDDEDSGDASFEDTESFEEESIEESQDNFDSGFEALQDTEENDFTEFSDEEAAENTGFSEDFSNDSEEVQEDDPQEVSPLRDIEVSQQDEVNEVPDISTTPAKDRESFADVREFANNMSYGTVKVGGNPAFSILLRGIISEDSHESIIAILNEHGLLGNDEALTRTSLELGHLLIPQISEFSAVFLSGKLRKYARDIQVGLAEEIHNSKSYDNDNKGLVSKRSIFQNKDMKYKREDNEFSIDDILTSTRSSINEYEVLEHIGVITQSAIHSIGDLSEQTIQYSDTPENADLEIGSNEIYTTLLNTLKNSAFKLGANALLSINYSMSPISDDGETKYNLICTADAVVLQRGS